MKIRPYRWYGGKFRMVEIVNNLIPEHEAYYEPYMGSASVMLNHPRSKSEYINDFDEDLVHFMQTLADKDKGKMLIDRLSKTEYGKQAFDIAKLYSDCRYTGLDDVEKAAQIYILITQSFNATRKSFSNGGYKSTYHYHDDIMRNLPLVQERLQGVTITQGDGLAAVKDALQNEKAFLFLDPPYRKDVRGKGADKAYIKDMPELKDHVKLLNTIKNAKCKIMLCGYRSDDGIDLYDKHLIPYGWKSYKLCEITKSCQSNKKAKDKGEEFIWVNYELPITAPYVISMKEYNSLDTVDIAA